MITEKEALNKLYEMPEHFDRHMRNKDYRAAKRVYDNAVVICIFLEVSTAVKRELFGDRPYIDNPDAATDGLFREEYVLKAYEETFKHRVNELAEEKENRERYKDRIIYRGLMTKK